MTEISPQFEFPVTTFDQEGIRYDIVLPHAERDYIQQILLKTGKPYELAMLQDMRRKLSPGDLVLDVGANIGNHSLYLAAIAQARVVAFEPNPALCAAMASSIARNGLQDLVSIRTLGLGSMATAAHFARALPENLGTQALTLGDGDISVVPLDSLGIEDQVRAIKIDVEGMELQVLEGGKALITRDRPILYIECQDEATFHQISNWTQAQGYTYWETFNATPTHLFLPTETVSFDQRLAHLFTHEVIQDYRLTSKLRKSRKAQAEAEAEAKQLEVELADEKGKIGALEAAITTLEREKSGLAAQVATEHQAAIDMNRNHERQAKAIKGELAQANAELVELRDYGRKLEAKHTAVLKSRTWLAMEPVRYLLRSLKRRPAPPLFVPRLNRPNPAKKPAMPVIAPSLLGFDASVKRSDKKIVFLATYPARLGNLPRIVEALLPQCDVLCVYLNEYATVPDCLKSDRIHVILGKDAAGDLKDNGKFFSTADYPNGYHILVDDDLVYPPDYVNHIIDGIRRFGYHAVVGFHGAIYKMPLTSYIKDRMVLPFYDESDDTFVDQLGTGTVGYHTSTFSIDLAAFGTTKTADLWFAKHAAEQGVPLVALARSNRWLIAMKEIGDPIFRQVQRDESHESALLKEYLAPALRRSPRVKIIDFLQSLYTPAYLERRGLDVTRSLSGAFGTTEEDRKSDIHFAIIITGWNCQNLVEASLASIQNQNPGKYTLDIYAYEDGSDDDTWRVLTEKAEVLNLRMFRGDQNMGAAFARNRLLRQVQDGSDICVLLDMDDQLLPYALAELEKIYRKNPECWMTYGNWINQNGQINDEGVYSDAEIDSRAYRALEVFRFTHLRSFRRFLYDRVEDVHLKDEDGNWLRYCSDVGLMLPIADQCSSRNVVALERPMYLYVQYRSTGTQKRFGVQKKKMLNYLRNNEALFRY